jgi:hypothetical protein
VGCVGLLPATARERWSGLVGTTLGWHTVGSGIDSWAGSLTGVPSVAVRRGVKGVVSLCAKERSVGVRENASDVWRGQEECVADVFCVALRGLCDYAQGLKRRCGVLFLIVWRSW